MIRTGVSYGEQSAQLKAFTGFFRRVNAGQTPGYPRFKPAHRFDSVEWLLSCDEVPTRPLEPTGAAVGVDLGIASFATTSDGEHVPDPGYGRVAAIKHMVRRPPPRPDPDQPGRFLPNRAAAKIGLNPSMNNAGWAQFVSILHAKAEEAGRVVIDVDPRHTSDRCGACGHTLNADQHAARSILRAGLARLAADPAV
ncbi:MAG TPA: transposase [Actinomycetota bacterium]|nr:transposase [Actinomycetota bacterium]